MQKIFWVIVGLVALLGLSLQISCRESRLRNARGVIEQAEVTASPAARSPAMKSADSPLISSSPVAPLLANAVTDTFSPSAKSQSTGEIFKAFKYRRKQLQEAVDRKFVPAFDDPSTAPHSDFGSLQPLFHESDCWRFRIQCPGTSIPQTLSLGFSGNGKNETRMVNNIDLAARVDDITYLLFRSDGRLRSGPEFGRQYLLYDDSVAEVNLCDSYAYLALRVPLSSTEPLWFAGFNMNSGKWEPIPASQLVNSSTEPPIEYGSPEDPRFFSSCYAGDQP